MDKTVEISVRHIISVGINAGHRENNYSDLNKLVHMVSPGPDRIRDHAGYIAFRNTRTSVSVFRAAVDVSKKQGILLGAHIPMGPSRLSLDRSQIESFQGFATSLLDASEISRANREASLRESGNLPWNRCVDGFLFVSCEHTAHAQVNRCASPCFSSRTIVILV